MKRIYERIPVMSILYHVQPQTKLILIDDRIADGKSAVVYEGPVKDFGYYNSKINHVSTYVAERAEVRRIIPYDECLEIHIDTRHEEF